jgi:3D (Asp-Asp-Asp) domain-containing protein
MHITLVRVLEERYVEETPLPFETLFEPDPGMELDQRKIIRWGREGASRRRIRVRFENGEEISRTQEAEWVAQEPRDRIIKFGSRIVPRQLDTPQGPITYWRKLRMLATSYNASTAGKPSDHPTYGLTRLGLRARKGIVAIDPRVINMHQELYVPGYGRGVAADTGSAIKWRRIDLCYDDDNLELWHKWVDVYLLMPVPDDEDIVWIIPNWPIEKE